MNYEIKSPQNVKVSFQQKPLSLITKEAYNFLKLKKSSRNISNGKMELVQEILISSPKNSFQQIKKRILFRVKGLGIDTICISTS